MAPEQTIHLDRYTAEAKSLVGNAQSLADERKHGQVEPLHLLARSLERDRSIGEVFRKAGVDPRDMAAEAEAQLRLLPTGTGALAYLSPAMLELLRRAEKEAGQDSVGLEHLLNALSQELKGGAATALHAFGLGPGSFRPHTGFLKTLPREVLGATTASALASSASTSTSASTEARDRFTTDLLEKAKQTGFDPVIGRDGEVRRLLQILQRRGKQHPLLVGEAGVGKRAIVGALAQRMVEGDVPEALAKLGLVGLDTGALVAGTKLRGEVEERLRKVIEGLRKGGAEGPLLFIEGIDGLLQQGGGSVGDLLRSLVSRGELRLLATTTPEGLRRIQDKDPAFLRTLSPLPIEPPTAAQAIEILRGIAVRYEDHHGVRIGDPALVAAVRLAKRYLQERALPDTALDLLDEAAARKRVEQTGVPADFDNAFRRLASVKAQMASLADDVDTMSVATRQRLEDELRQLEPKVVEMRSQLASRRGALAAHMSLQKEHETLLAQMEDARTKKEFARLGELEHVTLPEVQRRLQAAQAAVARLGPTDHQTGVREEDVAAVLGEWTGIPVAKMLEAESDKLLKMEDRLGARVVGQQQAVTAVAKAVRRGRVGLRDPGKPIGSFLLLGPSGVGKTELAKALAEFLFDDEQSLTRLDMSEFMEKHMAQRLVGAPPGYADSEEGGFLTEAVRRRPYSVLLFDEIEKAHGDVFNLLLQVLDDGRLTDGRGRTADFSNTVVILTSNIGSKRILDAEAQRFETPEGRDALRAMLDEELRAFLRPELINRIDDIVIFQPLTKADLRGVIEIQLKRLEKLVEERNISLTLTDAAKNRLVDLGYEPAYGARPLKRAILKHIQDPLAEQLLSGGTTAGSVVRVDAVGDEFVFGKG
jgi:ATP-dependent Clp protease ATP-binding subunit ClpB